MKKLLLCLLMLLITSCSSEQNTTLVCKLNSDSEYYTTQVTYVYNDDEIISLTSYSEYHLTDEDLTEYSLDDIYNVYVDGYTDYMDIQGITIEITKDDATNMIGESIKVTISEYDFFTDAYGIGDASDYSSMQDIFTMIEATDAIVCE